MSLPLVSEAAIRERMTALPLWIIECALAWVRAEEATGRRFTDSGAAIRCYLADDSVISVYARRTGQPDIGVR